MIGLSGFGTVFGEASLDAQLVRRNKFGYLGRFWLRPPRASVHCFDRSAIVTSRTQINKVPELHFGGFGAAQEAYFAVRLFAKYGLGDS